MTVRIATWNLGFNTDSSRHDEAWRYLLDEIKPDIALLQEVRVPEFAQSYGTCVLTQPTVLRWGSAIVAKRELAPSLIQLPTANPLNRLAERTTVAEVTLDNRVTLVASVHPRTGEPSASSLEGVDSAAVGRASGLWHDDIIYAGLRELTARANSFIVGGDWMESLLYDAKTEGTACREFLDRAEADGWVEASMDFFGSKELELRTWYTRRGGRTSGPYQNDRIFLDHRLAGLIIDCDAIAHPAQCLGLSDHAPLIVDLEC